MYNIRSYGAVGDGETLDTESIQQAIEACAREGGGTVLVPRGVWLTGTLWLRSHVHLHLEHGSVLRGSPNAEDYNADDAFPQNSTIPMEHVSGAHLLIALEVENVAITGEGTIDGNEQAFRGELLEPQPHWPLQEPVFGPAAWRPSQMVYFVESRDILVRGIHLRNAPFWNLLFHGCENVRVESLAIRVDRRTRNGDGVGIDCCRNVTVTNCLMDTSDDCITVRANGRKLLHTPALTENIAVSNCVMRTRTCGVRIGVGTGVIRNVVFTNMVATDMQSGIHITGKYTPASPGVLVENVRFSNFSIRARVAIHIASGYGATKPVRSVFFTNIDAETDGTSYIGGSPECPAEDIHFDNVRLRVHGGRKNDPNRESPYVIYSRAQSYSGRAIGMPYAFYLEYARNIQFDRFRVEWERIDGVWTHTFYSRDCQELGFHNIRTALPATEQAAAVVYLERTGDSLVKGCALAGKSGQFLDGDAESLATTRFLTNDF